MEIENRWSSGRRTPIINFYAKICVESMCCETGVMSQRDGPCTFSEDFQNLGNCNLLEKDPNKTVRVTARKVGTRQSPLKVMTITAQFDDDSLVRAENVWYGTRYPLPWGETRNMVESEVDLPQAHCPEDLTPQQIPVPKKMSGCTRK